MKNSIHSHQNITTEVDKFICQILTDRIPIDEVIETLSWLYPAMMHIYDDSVCYVETVQWFIGICQMLVGDLYPNEVVCDSSLVEDFLYHVNSYRQCYLNTQDAFRFQERKNTNTLIEYIEQLSNHYAKLLFVRVDLKYKYDMNSSLDIYTFNEGIKRLCERISNKKSCFKHLEGFVWALEQGEKNGRFHCHLLLIYNGSKRQNGYLMAKQVGEKWIKITDSSGTYFNCHDNNYLKMVKHNYGLGIGMIHRDKPLEVQNAIRTACYLTSPDKFSQRLKIKLPNMRTFGHGQFKQKHRRGIHP